MPVNSPLWKDKRVLGSQECYLQKLAKLERKQAGAHAADKLIFSLYSNEHSTRNTYFSVSVKNGSKFQIIYLTNSEQLPEAVISYSFLAAFFLFCHNLISPGLLTNSHQSKTFTK